MEKDEAVEDLRDYERTVLVPSTTDPTKVYEVRVFANGSSCSCMGFTFARLPFSRRRCRHTETVNHMKKGKENR